MMDTEFARFRRVAACAILLLSPVASIAANWPSLRGPLGTGVAPDADPPIGWGEEKNVLWKVELEGAGHASPAIWGERVYVLSAVQVAGEEAAEPAKPTESAPPGERPPRTAPKHLHRFVVAAYDLESGRRAWSTVVREEVPHEALHPTASQASASAVTDGEHVIAFFGSRGLYALDLEGKVVWKKDLGTQTTRNEFGEGATPLLHNDRVVVNWDHEGDSFIVAFDKKTGEELWRNARDEPTSWSTPAVVRDGERELVVVSAANFVRAYDLVSGDEVWRVAGLGLNVVPTPVADDETVWVMSGWREARGMAIRYPGARGDLTGTDRVLWQIEEGLSYVPSAVLVDDRLHFFQRFGGILSCYELATGTPCYERRRIESFENIYASPVAVGDRIYAVSRDGEAIVFRAGPDFEILARNELDDVFNATPAVAGDRLVLRGDRHLYAIAAPDGAGSPTKTAGAYLDAIETSDLDSAEALFGGESLVFEGGSVEGTWAEYRAHHIGAELDAILSFEIERGDPASHVSQDGTLAFVAWPLDYTIELREGRVIESRATVTFVLEREGERWAIRHLHWSSRRRPAPADG